MIVEYAALTLVSDRIILLGLLGLLAFACFNSDRLGSTEDNPCEALPSQSSPWNFQIAVSVTVAIVGSTVSGLYFEPAPPQTNGDPIERWEQVEISKRETETAPHSLTQQEPILQTFDERLQHAKMMERRGLYDLAAVSYRDAISDGSITLAEAALPMMGLARIALKNKSFDRAMIYADLASAHLDGSTENVNVVARILVKHCRLADALKRLSGLSHQNEESLQLMAMASAPGTALACEEKGTTIS